MSRTKVSINKFCLAVAMLSAVPAISSAQQVTSPDTVAFSLSVEDIVVTATAVNGASNIQRLNQTAIQHQQTSSVADLMQLLPGVLTENPTLNKQSQITIRDTKDTDANKQGVAIIADGVDLNNDANLQLKSTNTNNLEDSNESALKGTDLRPLSTDAIESMTVIRGVAPAEYGNLTSGAVIINYNNRPRPLTFVLKTDPRLKSLSAEYGHGHLNTNADYAISQNDERSNTEKFQRVGLRLAYHNTFGIASITSTANAHYVSNINKTDPDLASFKKISHLDKSISWANTIKLRATNRLAPIINIEAIGKIQSQKDDELEEHLANMPTAYTDAVTEGNNPGKFYPVNYTEFSFIHGKPLSGQIKILLRKVIGTEENMNSISLGAHMNLQRNYGEGKGGSYMNPSIRPRKFKDIPHLGSTAIFIEDKVNIHDFQGQFGLRATHINAPEYSFPWQLEPRLSAKYSFSNLLSLAASWGIMKKLPTLIHLYPDPQYADFQTSAKTDAEGVQSCTFTTHLIKGVTNPDIKLPSTNNLEITAVSKLPVATLTLTFYKEHLSNGYGFKSRVEPYRVETASPDTTFAKYYTPRNNIKHEKWGIEYIVDFARIAPLNMSIYVDGAYMHILRTDTETEQTYEHSLFNGRLRSVAAEVLSSNSWYNVTQSDRLNTNARFIIHIPRFALVATIKAQGVWIDRTKRMAKYNNEDMAYINTSDNRVNVNPVYLIDKNGNNIPFDKNIAHGQKYIHYTTSTALKSDDPKPYGQVDVKISKEIAHRAQFSLYVNNITNCRPKRYYASLNTNIYNKQGTYFGCDLRIKI